MRAKLQSNVERFKSARTRRARPLASAIGALLPPSGAGAPRVCLAAMALALGFSASVDAANTFTVNTTGDPGPGGTLSLRQAISQANGSDFNTVQFDPTLRGSTITLTSGQIAINRGMSIVGLGVGETTISGNDLYPIFEAFCGEQEVILEHMRLTHGKAVAGGAIRTSFCELQLVDVDITNNTADDRGGAIYAPNAIVGVTSSSISGNSAKLGGGIAGYLGTLVIHSSTISGNQAMYQGGGLYLSHMISTTVNYSTISGNSIPVIAGPYSTPVGGAGAALNDSPLTTVNSTIANNYAFGGGGGIRFFDSGSSNSAYILSTTIAGNSTCCYDAGNGILATGGTVSIRSSIVANNFNRGGNDDVGGSFKIDGSLVRSPGSAAIIGSGSIFGVDPKLGQLGVNGGPTLTMLPSADSPALDNYTCAQVALPLDQRGVGRCVNGHVDMGAVERQVPEVIIFRNGFDPGG